MRSTNHPTLFTIFGGTGDLAKNKLLPALLDLYIKQLLPDNFRVVGFARSEYSDEEYRRFVQEAIDAKGHDHSAEAVSAFCDTIHYQSGNFDTLEDYTKLAELLGSLDREIGQCTSKLFYLAVPPQFYDVIFDNIHTSRLTKLCDGKLSWARLLVEKPFGKDLESAQALEKKLCDLFEEEQIFRIDHYLAKDAIENILSLRFANTILESSWNGEFIEKVEITLSESRDLATRGSFYDGIGELRDMGASHILQMLSLVAMEHPQERNPEKLRKARAEILRTLKTYDDTEVSEHVVRGQYNGYKTVTGVSPESQTETYFMLRAFLDTPRWKDVPFYLRSGKALHESKSEVVVHFKPISECACEFSGGSHTHHNVMVMTLAPKQVFKIGMWVKRPGFDFAVEPRELILDESAGDSMHSPEAYEKVLFDCIEGDQSRFVSSEEVAAAWSFITPILEGWHNVPLEQYDPGSTGPQQLLTT